MVKILTRFERTNIFFAEIWAMQDLLEVYLSRLETSTKYDICKFLFCYLFQHTSNLHVQSLWILVTESGLFIINLIVLTRKLRTPCLAFTPLWLVSYRTTLDYYPLLFKILIWDCAGIYLATRIWLVVFRRRSANFVNWLPCKQKLFILVLAAFLRFRWV